MKAKYVVGAAEKLAQDKQCKKIETIATLYMHAAALRNQPNGEVVSAMALKYLYDSIAELTNDA